MFEKLLHRRIEMGEKVIVNIKTFEDGHTPPNRLPKSASERTSTGVLIGPRRARPMKAAADFGWTSTGSSIAAISVTVMPRS